jgi:hypothetical protein
MDGLDGERYRDVSIGSGENPLRVRFGPSSFSVTAGEFDQQFEDK